MSDELAFQTLETYLALLPGVAPYFGHGHEPDGQWWVKFSIDVDNPLAWHVVQELAHVLNYLSVGERLPTVIPPKCTGLRSRVLWP
jgi:hypothetical protein